MNTPLFIASAGLGTLLSILYLAALVLGVMLFIKIWKACNDIHRIADKLDSDE